MRRNQKGFSLIELLIVVAIILIISAIAVPNLLSARAAANESSAVGSLRTLDVANETYSSTYGVGYAPNLAALGPAASATSASADLIDNVLATGTKTGYTFAYNPGTADSSGNINTFMVNANPVSSATGTRYFYLDQTAVVTAAYGTAASSSDTPLQ
jgi:type IV pilus assembly protein PilA